MPDAFLGNFLQPGLNRLVHRRGDPDVEPAVDERKPQWFTGQLSKLHANPAQNAFTRLEYDTAGLNELLEFLPFGAEPVGVRPLDLRVELEHAVSGGAAIAMQTAGRFQGGFPMG